MGHWLRQNLSGTFDILCAGFLILCAEEARTVLGQPGAELTQFGFEAVDRCSIHVGLGDDLGKIDWIVKSVLFTRTAMQGNGGTDQPYG